MGHMDVVKIVSDYFNVYFPILLLLLTASTYFSVGARLLTTLGFQQFLDQESEVRKNKILPKAKLCLRRQNCVVEK